MPDAEQRDIAEALFEKQSREEIKNAIIVRLWSKTYTV
jgi:hypothetical protein